MPVTLSKKINPNIIPVKSMKDGQLAEIINCRECNYKGRIVMRYKDILISVGENSEESWPNILTCLTTTMTVRILQSGEQLTIV